MGDTCRVHDSLISSLLSSPFFLSNWWCDIGLIQNSCWKSVAGLRLIRVDVDSCSAATQTRCVGHTHASLHQHGRQTLQSGWAACVDKACDLLRGPPLSGTTTWKSIIDVRDFEANGTVRWDAHSNMLWFTWVIIGSCWWLIFCELQLSRTRTHIYYIIFGVLPVLYEI